MWPFKKKQKIVLVDLKKDSDYKVLYLESQKVLKELYESLGVGYSSWLNIEKYNAKEEDPYDYSVSIVKNNDKDWTINDIVSIKDERIRTAFIQAYNQIYPREEEK